MYNKIFLDIHLVYLDDPFFFYPVKAQSAFCALALPLHAPCTNCRFLGELVGCVVLELNELQQVKGPQ